MDEKNRDTLEEVYQAKREISAAFSTYEEFAAWLMREQEKSRKAGIVFCAA